ncbi:MAG: hypothetical protein K0S16_1636 [Moraxellaceae bacterium]|jgi:short subunit dehydrogenase-like uncharacterized protein|nr:hypothetical protein [Moraxellaceae bacterium]
MQWMIYGANGYTGELIAREARMRGLKPVLAGRNVEKLRPLAQELQLDFRAFSLEMAYEVDRGLKDIGLVLHCAGPFSHTSAPMIAGCLRHGAHYLDITGEIGVFEHAHAQNEAAKDAGIVVCPGVGFDVIPTDCVAAALKRALPDATHLALGFDSRSGFSPGTAKTSVEGLALGGRARVNGRIVEVPLAWKTRTIDFGDGEKLAMTIPWGDVATAYYSTGIPNIEVYLPGSPRLIRNAKRANYLRWLLKWGIVQDLLKAQAGKTQGPNAQQREKMPTHVWGEARNAKGETKTARIRTANGYSLTVTGSLAVVQQLLTRQGEGGAFTPSRLFGPEFVEMLPGSGRISIT